MLHSLHFLGTLTGKPDRFKWNVWCFLYSLLFQNEVDVSVLIPVLNLSKLVPLATSEKTDLW